MRPLYLSLAGLFLALATAGVFLPLLPTTPFLLLTSWFLVRSSPSAHARLVRSPLFGPLLRDWERERGVRLQVKLSALAVLTLVVAVSLFTAALPAALQVLLVALAALGATVIVRLPTVAGPSSAGQSKPDESDTCASGAPSACDTTRAPRVE